LLRATQLEARLRHVEVIQPVRRCAGPKRTRFEPACEEVNGVRTEEDAADVPTVGQGDAAVDVARARRADTVAAAGVQEERAKVGAIDPLLDQRDAVIESGRRQARGTPIYAL
jgi:hypothetical protein